MRVSGSTDTSMVEKSYKVTQYEGDSQGDGFVDCRFDGLTI